MSKFIVWSFRIADTAYKNIVPLSMKLKPEVELVHSSGFLWWKKEEWRETGRWIIQFKYDRGPMTKQKIDMFVFENRETAEFWYQHTHTTVFLGQVDAPPPPLPKPKQPKKKKSHLSLVKDKI